jgi:hypothetical protein
VPTTSLQTGRQLGTSTVPVAVRWTALDSGSGLVAVRLESSRASGAWKTHATTLTATGSALSIDTSAAWRVRVTAADAAGNSSTRTTEFPVRASVVQDGARSISYSGRWTRVARDAASGGSIRYSRTANSTATYTFTGRSVAWVAAVGPDLGRARVSIDGRVVATVDLGGSRQQRRLVFSRNWSRAGKHTIRIRVLGTPGRPRVELDGFVVLT